MGGNLILRLSVYFIVVENKHTQVLYETEKETKMELLQNVQM